MAKTAIGAARRKGCKRGTPFCIPSCLAALLLLAAGGCAGGAAQPQADESSQAPVAEAPAAEGSQVAQPQAARALPALELAELQALSPDETTAFAKDAGVLETTYMYRYEPFDAKLSTLVDTQGDPVAAYADLAKSDASVMPDIAASSAFYPFAATVVDARYTRDAYENSENGLAMAATPQAFADLAAGVPLIVIASEPNDDQKADIAASGRDIRCEPVAREALAFYVRDDGLLAQGADAGAGAGEIALTSDEIRRIYTSDDPAYTPFALEHGNGSTMCFEEFMTGSSGSLDVSARTQVYPDMVSIVGGAALTDRSIGFAFHQFYQHNCSSPAMELATVDGVALDWGTVRSGAYPVMFDVCVLYDADGPYAAEAEAFIAWLRSDEGRQVVYDVGLGQVRV